MAKKEIKTLVIDAANLRPLWIEARKLVEKELKNNPAVIVQVQNTKVPLKKQRYRLGHHDVKVVPGIQVNIKDNQLYVSRVEA